MDEHTERIVIFLMTVLFFCIFCFEKRMRILLRKEIVKQARQTGISKAQP